MFDVLSGAAAARGIVWKNVPFSVSQVAASRRVNSTAVPGGETRSMSVIADFNSYANGRIVSLAGVASL